MPLYDFTCRVCGHTDEVFLNMTDDTTAFRACPACPTVKKTGLPAPLTFERRFTPVAIGNTGTVASRPAGRILGDPKAKWGTDLSHQERKRIERARRGS